MSVRHARYPAGLPLSLSLRARAPLNTLAMLCADALAVSVALALAGLTVALAWNPGGGGAPYWAAALVLAWLVTAFGEGMYPGWGLGAERELRRAARTTAVAFGASLAVAAVTIPPVGPHSAAFIGLAGLLAAGLVPLARAGARELLARTGGWGAPTVVIGTGLPGRAMVRMLSTEARHGFQPVAMLDPDGAADGSLQGLPLFSTVDAAARAGARVALLAMPDATRERLGGVLDEALTRFGRVVIAQDLLEAQSLGVSATHFGDHLAFDLHRDLSSRLAQAVKRAFDLVCVLLAAPAWLPLVGLIAFITWLEDRHPPFYRQPRVGHEGRVFKVWKLRTMVPNAEVALRRHLETDAAARTEWETHFKLRRDPRITRAGAFFRKASLDELPQLFNVLAGEMSLVGPRPLPAYHQDALPPKAAALRLRAKPGLTGLWQVEGRSDTDLAGMARLDTHYIRNWSFWLDLTILARTVLVVAFGKGAY